MLDPPLHVAGFDPKSGLGGFDSFQQKRSSSEGILSEQARLRLHLVAAGQLGRS
jgi:hypothetical protein